MNLEATHKEYDRAMKIAADHIQELNTVLCGIGFEKSDLKTTSFDVDTEYGYVKILKESERVFQGYKVMHRMKLTFDLDMQRLSQTLSAIAGCLAHPQLSIDFTIKDTTAINEELLRSAAINAKKQADILCDAAGVTMGELIAIDYNWGELDVYSHTRYDCCEEALMECDSMPPTEIEPEDIKVSDTATFVWEIRWEVLHISNFFCLYANLTYGIIFILE